MKIVHLDTGLELRGGQFQLLLLAHGLRARGHEQMIACPEWSVLEQRTRQEGFRVFALPRHDPAGAHGILALRQQLRLEPCDVLHAHDARGQTTSWLASLGMRVRRVASRRVSFLPRRLGLHGLKYTRTSDAVVAISRFVRQLLVDSGVPEARIELIPDGVEIPETLPDALTRARIRARWRCSAQEFVVGHVGAWTLEKGQDIAMQAAGLLRDKAPEVRLVLAADFFGSALLASSPTVHIERYSGNPAEFFPGLDLYIMPSRAEGLGSSALAAMAYGVPVVATRVGGLPEVIGEGHEEKGGWLIEPESPAALATAIAAASAGRARLARLAANARQRARCFSVDIMLDRTEALYARLVR